STLLLFFFNDTATTEIYTLSLHDALPISPKPCARQMNPRVNSRANSPVQADRKSTRLNSSHPSTSYAVFCLKKKNIQLGTNQSSSKLPPRTAQLMLIELR